jgi:hypothetical protein
MKQSKSQTLNQETPLLLPTVTPMYPFKNGCEHFVVGCGEYILPEDASMVFEKTIGLPANKSRLKAFLSQECNVTDPTHYSFPDIIAALRLYIERSCSKNSVDKSRTPKEGATEKEITPKKDVIIKENEKWPDDLITLTVAESKYHVTSLTLRRAIAANRLRSYRPKNCTKNHPHKVSKSQVASCWPAKILQQK